MPEGQLLLVFESTKDCDQVNNLAARCFKASIIPTPAEITSGCGSSLQFFNGHRIDIMEFMETLYVPAEFYHLSDPDETGARTAKLVAACTGDNAP